MGNLLIKAFGNKNDPFRVCMLGLDAAGKTTVVQQLKCGQCTRTLPTIGFNVDTVTPCKGLTLTVWDIGGQDKIRQLWKHYYTTTEGIIYIVDSADENRFEEAASELGNILRERDVSKEIKSALHLDKLEDSSIFHIQGCCAVQGDGITEAFETLGKYIRKSRKEKASAT